MNRWAIVCTQGEKGTVWEFFPAVGKLVAKYVIEEPEFPYRSLLNGDPVGPGTPHALGKPGLGYIFDVEHATTKGVDVSFRAVAREEQGGVFHHVQLNGLSQLPADVRDALKGILDTYPSEDR